MLGRRGWCLAVLLMACGEEDPPVEVRMDAAVIDARVKDARSSSEAATTEDARVVEDADVVATIPVPSSWRDQAEGIAATPNEVCTRRWVVDERATGWFLVSDAAGNLIVAGRLEADQDFGTGVLQPPKTTIGRTSTFVLKLDAACNLVWSKLFAVEPDMLFRRPLSLGVDDQQRITLLTQSSRYKQAGIEAYYEESRLDILLLTPDGDESARKTFSQPYGKPLSGTVQTNGHGLTLITHATSEGGPHDFGAGIPEAVAGDMVNNVLRADGSLIYRQIYNGTGGFGGLGQRLGPQGEIVASGVVYTDHDGGIPNGSVTLSKLDSTGKLSWEKELQPRTAMPLTYSALGVADDGSFTLWQRYTPTFEGEPTQSLQARTPDGDRVWDMPIAQSLRNGFWLNVVRTTSRSIALHGSLAGEVRLGNISIDSNTLLETGVSVVAQLETGGATRWALATPKGVAAIDVTPNDEVALLQVDGANLVVSKLSR